MRSPAQTGEATTPGEESTGQTQDEPEIPHMGDLSSETDEPTAEGPQIPHVGDLDSETEEPPAEDSPKPRATPAEYLASMVRPHGDQQNMGHKNDDGRDVGDS